MAEKEGDFGGLPSTLFAEVVTFLNAQIAGGSSTSGAAAAALAMLAEEEHSAANPKVDLQIVEVVFALIATERAFRKLQAASSGTLGAELTSFANQLKSLRDFWAGK
jgi:hypothetical protein